MIGRMLFAIISGQMLGSIVSGFANDAFGWHSALVIGAGGRRRRGGGRLARHAAGARAGARRDSGSFADLYGRVLANPKAPWLIGGVAVEGAFFYGLFPYMGELLLATARPPAGSIAGITGVVLGAFGVGGLLYAASVRALAAPARRAPHVPDRLGCGGGLLRGARVRADLVAGRAGDVPRRRQLLHAAQLDADRGDRAGAVGARLGGRPVRVRLLHRPGARAARLRRPAARDRARGRRCSPSRR